MLVVHAVAVGAEDTPFGAERPHERAHNGVAREDGAADHGVDHGVAVQHRHESHVEEGLCTVHRSTSPYAINKRCDTQGAVKINAGVCACGGGVCVEDGK